MDNPYKDLTNIEFMTNVMDFSKQGALMQVYILEAISNYSKHFAHKTEEEIEHMKKTWGFIDPEAWQRCAKEYLEKYELKNKT